MSEGNPILEKVRLEREELIHQQTETLRKLISKISILTDELLRIHDSRVAMNTELGFLESALTEMEHIFHEETSDYSDEGRKNRIIFLLKNLQQQDVPLWNKEIYRIRKTTTDNGRGYTEDDVTTPITVEEIINSSNTKEMIALLLRVYGIDIMETMRNLIGTKLHG